MNSQNALLICVHRPSLVHTVQSKTIRTVKYEPVSHELGKTHAKVNEKCEQNTSERLGIRCVTLCQRKYTKISLKPSIDVLSEHTSCYNNSYAYVTL